MATGFSAFVAPDSHIAFLAHNPGLVHSYIDGEIPELIESVTLPAGWPTHELESLGGWGINYGNVDLYHWILNGSPELVEGAGSIFQTWYEPDKQSAALKLDKLNERFGFYAAQLDELATLVEAVSVSSVQKAFTDWCRSKGKHVELDEDECEPFAEEFSMFAKGLREAIKRGYGIIW